MRLGMVVRRALAHSSVGAVLAVCAAVAVGCDSDDDGGASGSGATSGSTAGGGAGGTAGTASAGTSGSGAGGTTSGGGSGSSAGTGGGSGSTAGSSGKGAGSGGAGAGDAAAPDAGGKDGGPPDSGPGSQAKPLAEQVCPAGASFGDPLPSGSPAAQPVQGGFGFLEGPVWLADKGWLLFSDMDMGAGGSNGPPSRIRRLMPPSMFDVFVESGNSNGLALDLDGAVLACTHDMQTLSRYLPSNGMRETLALKYMGKHFNSPNDLTVRSDGTVYFTDPDWQLAGRTNETGMTGVYRVSPDDEVSLVEGSLDKPNGVALSPDEHTLYVGSAGSDILAYPVNADGSVGQKRVLASPGPADGLGVDCAGNLYVTGGNSVKVFGPSGDSRGSISVAGSTSNVAFGGSDRKTLYITAGNTLYSIVLNVPGLPY